MLMKLQELCKSCRSLLYFILAFAKLVKLVHNSGMQELYFILFAYILVQMGERFNSILTVNS